MKEKTDDILQRKELKENPFGAPAGYFSSLQQEVMDKISAMPHDQYVQDYTPASKPTFLTFLKPALTLASVFGIVIGMGYGAMKLTDIIGKGNTAAETSAPIAENTQHTLELSEDYMASILDITIEDLFTASENQENQIDIIYQEIDSESIEQYLIDAGVSASSIALLE